MGESNFITTHYAGRGTSAASFCRPAPAFFYRLIRSAVDPGAPACLKRAMRVQDLITNKLTEAFAPEHLQVIDESHRHEGHAGHRPGGETHFRVHIVSQ